MDGSNLCLILACWGSPLQVQWRQMGTNTSWFEGRSVPSLKWTEAWGPSGRTGWCPWPWGWLELCVFRGWGGRMRWTAIVFHQLHRGGALMYDGELSSWSGGSIVWDLAELRRDLTNGKLSASELRVIVGLLPGPQTPGSNWDCDCIWNRTQQPLSGCTPQWAELLSTECGNTWEQSVSPLKFFLLLSAHSVSSCFLIKIWGFDFIFWPRLLGEVCNTVMMKTQLTESGNGLLIIL